MDCPGGQGLAESWRPGPCLFGAPSEGEGISEGLLYLAQGQQQQAISNCLLTTPSSWTEFSCLGGASSDYSGLGPTSKGWGVALATAGQAHAPLGKIYRPVHTHTHPSRAHPQGFTTCLLEGRSQKLAS